MYLKPVKSYGKEYKLQIYKHYVVKKNSIVDSQAQSYVLYNGVKYIGFIRCVCGSYRTFGVTTDLTIDKFTEAQSQTLYGKLLYKPLTTSVNKVGDCVLYEYLGKQVAVLITRLECPQDSVLIDCITSDTELSNVKKLYITRDEMEPYSKALIDKFELNKYFYYGDMAYIPIDDIQETEEQYIKGYSVKGETRAIRYDIDTKLNIQDVVVIDNVAYIVEDITKHTKIGLNKYVTYTASLMKLGV